MECAAALEAMRGKLEQNFGKALAMMILASASNSVGCTTVGLETEEFCRLADAVAADQRVIDMWGAAGAQDALASWKALVA